MIAAAGVWRIGRYLGGHGEHASDKIQIAEMSYVEILGLGLAGGIVPCWDAVGLLVLAAALGRLEEGVGLVLAFSAGMGLVLLAVGWLAWKFKARMVVLNDGAVAEAAWPIMRRDPRVALGFISSFKFDWHFVGWPEQDRQLRNLFDGPRTHTRYAGAFRIGRWATGTFVPVFVEMQANSADCWQDLNS